MLQDLRKTLYHRARGDRAYAQAVQCAHSGFHAIASFPGLSKGGGERKAWGLLHAHAQKITKKVVIVYYSNLSVTLVSILQDTGSVFYLCVYKRSIAVP